MLVSMTMAIGVQFDPEEGFDPSKVYNESDEEPDVADLVIASTWSSFVEGDEQPDCPNSLTLLECMEC